MNINTRPSLNRQPSQKGIQMSGIKSRREFAQKISQSRTPNPQSLGRGAVSLQKSSGISINVTI